MNVEKISKFTAELLLKYYDNNIQLFLDACADDVLWIGPAENQVIRTSRALKSAFAAEHNNLHFAVHDLKAVPLTTGSPHVCEVVLFFIVDTIWPDESVSRVKQRIHFTWVEKNGEAKIRLCHISNAIAYDERDHIYPIHYDENYPKFSLAGERRSDRLRIKTIDRSVLYLDRKKILYIETFGHHTIVHTSEQEYESTESMNVLEKYCKDFMVRCHASYLVNPVYVKEIRRFILQLSNGTQLPIPEKKYTSVKNELTHFFSSRSTTP